ncbi:MAG: RNase adapter RapZ [Acetobacteraceae bacterium]|jgi:RNase adapter protein RapZ
MTQTRPPGADPRRIVVVSGLSGGGKASILHALEDVGYDAVDNLPLGLVEDLAACADRDIALGVDARTRGFDADVVLDTLANLRRNPALLPELIYAWADEATLLRRYTETRRRHPLAPRGRVTEGIEIEQELTAPLRESANLIIDTSELPLASLRHLIEQRFGPLGDKLDARMMVSLISFAYGKGLPKEADLVFDARFLRNPHYDPMLRPRTGLDPEVGAYIREDQGFEAYLSRITDLVDLVLPRFVHEGKKYATIAIGCTGGRHRSVYMVECLAAHMASRLTAMHAGGESGLDWRQTVTHRELRPGEARPGELTVQGQTEGAPHKEALTGGALSGALRAPETTGNDVRSDGDGQKTTSIQAQEA